MRRSFLEIFIMISVLRPAVFEQIARLAVKRLAELLQCADLYRLRLAVFEYGNIRHRDAHALRKLRNAHFALGKHHVYIKNYFSHLFLRYAVYSYSKVALLLQICSFLRKIGQDSRSSGDRRPDKHAYKADYVHRRMVHIKQ